MLKIIFELLTSPLGLPIGVFWEWAILLIIGEVAHEIAYWVSPGGKEFGSCVYWATKFLTFAAMWAIIYAIIYAIIFVVEHWVWFVICCGTSLLVGILIWIIVFKKKKRNERLAKEKTVNKI